MEKFAERLQWALDKEHKKNIDLARFCEVSPQAVTQWFSTGKISPDNLDKIAVLLKVNREWLRTGRGNPDTQHVDSVSGLDDDMEKLLPLVDIHSLSLKEYEVVRKNALASGRTATARFHCGNKSLAFKMIDKSMEPGIIRGSIVVIDPELEIEPDDVVVFHMLTSGARVIRKFGYLPNGNILLLPENSSHQRFEMTPSQFETEVEVLGVVTETTQPRRQP